MNQELKNGIIATVGIIIVVALVVGFLIVLPMWAYPQYRVWSRELRGKAELREAEWSRRIQVEEAQANLESEKLNAQSEVERAKGAAEAIRIEGGSLTDNYIKYLWVRQLNTGEKQLIYVPTEAGLPILEANRFGN